MEHGAWSQADGWASRPYRDMTAKAMAPHARNMATMQSQTMRLARVMYCQCAQAPKARTEQLRANTTRNAVLIGKG
jgi:hypothetical protein